MRWFKFKKNPKYCRECGSLLVTKTKRGFGEYSGEIWTTLECPKRFSTSEAHDYIMLDSKMYIGKYDQYTGELLKSDGS